MTSIELLCILVANPLYIFSCVSGIFRLNYASNLVCTFNFSLIFTSLFIIKTNFVKVYVSVITFNGIRMFCFFLDFLLTVVYLTCLKKLFIKQHGLYTLLMEIHTYGLNELLFHEKWCLIYMTQNCN